MKYEIIKLLYKLSNFISTKTHIDYRSPNTILIISYYTVNYIDIIY